MTLRVQRSEWFLADLEHYAAWFDHVAEWKIADRYLRAVASTLERLAEAPTLGHPTQFEAPELHGLRCLRVARPFHKHLIFYRHDSTLLYAERVVHGARDLPRRLTQPPAQKD